MVSFREVVCFLVSFSHGSFSLYLLLNFSFPQNVNSCCSRGVVSCSIVICSSNSGDIFGPVSEEAMAAFWHISEKQLLFFTLTVILEVEQAYYHHQWRYITQLLKVCHLLSYNLICFVLHIESIERNNFQSAWTRRWVIHITQRKPSSFNTSVQHVIIVLGQLCSGCCRI